MRLWSIHPRYLDAKGLVALWREGLLAKAVLEGKTKGYTAHPQLARFRSSKDSIKAINAYLFHVYQEAKARGYSFDELKIVQFVDTSLICVTKKQMEYEFLLLMYKLQNRDREAWEKLIPIKLIELHPIFFAVDGEIESWEKFNKEVLASGPI